MFTFINFFKGIDVLEELSSWDGYKSN